MKNCLHCNSSNLFYSQNKYNCLDCRHKMIIVEGKSENHCPDCDSIKLGFMRDMSGMALCFDCHKKILPKKIKLEEDRIDVLEY